MVKSLSPATNSRSASRAATGEVVEVGVDYITAVGKSGAAQESMQNLGAQLLCRWHAAGNETRPWSMKGYQGFICGPIQLGSREDSTILRVTGAEADSQWEKLWYVAESITRVDLQVTLRPKIDAAKLVARVRRQSCQWSNNRKDDPLVGWRGDNRGGATVYVGSRFSDKFGRCYIKGAESGLREHEGTVRFEVQFQKKTCAPALRLVHNSEVRMIAIAGAVSGFFCGRGVPLVLPSVPMHSIRVSREPANLERQLRWLESQVGPSIQRLIDAGCYNQVVAALGLRPPMSVQAEESQFLYGASKGEHVNE